MRQMIHDVQNLLHNLFKSMIKKLTKLQINAFFLLAVSAVMPVQASTADCQNLYIGRIWIEKGVGLKAVVYLNHPDDSSGSYWSYFSGWSADERKEALTILTTAKATKHRVNVVTADANGCGLQAGGTVTNQLFLATNP